MTILVGLMTLAIWIAVGWFVVDGARRRAGAPARFEERSVATGMQVVLIIGSSAVVASQVLLADTDGWTGPRRFLVGFGTAVIVLQVVVMATRFRRARR